MKLSSSISANDQFTSACGLRAVPEVTAEMAVPKVTAEMEAPGGLVRRKTLALRYLRNASSSVAMVGVCLNTPLLGRLETQLVEGRAKIRLRFDYVPHPQRLGAEYTSYVIWAIVPRVSAGHLNLGRLPISKDYSAEIGIALPYQTFGVIVTAEPHPLVRHPGPMIVAANLPGHDSRGDFNQLLIEYYGDSGDFYTADSLARRPEPDYHTPLCVSGARRAVEIARRASAGQYAKAKLEQAAARLGVLERLWPEQLKNGKVSQLREMSMEVMRLAEVARAMNVIVPIRASIHRGANRAKPMPGGLRSHFARCTGGLGQVFKCVGAAFSGTKRAKVMRLEIERARRQGEEIRSHLDRAVQQLSNVIPELLETRSDERGLVLKLSDLLFDNHGNLTTRARESLSRLTGMLVTYSRHYALQIEGHADSTGSALDSLMFSEGRAGIVRDYLVQAGLPAARIVSVIGLGKAVPLTTDETPVGRYLNRRVEIIIHQLGTEELLTVEHDRDHVPPATQRSFQPLAGSRPISSERSRQAREERSVTATFATQSAPSLETAERNRAGSPVPLTREVSAASSRASQRTEGAKASLSSRSQPDRQRFVDVATIGTRRSGGPVLADRGFRQRGFEPPKPPAFVPPKPPKPPKVVPCPPRANR